MPSLTAFPDANPETTTVDGYVTHNGADDVAWATKRDTGNSSGDSPATSTAPGIFTSGSGNNWNEIDRLIALFDTSAIPDTDVISAATMGVVSNGTGNTLGSQSISLCKPTPASNTALVAADYNLSAWDMTKQATDLTIASIVTDSATYNTWTLNATGLGNISKTGVTKLGLVITADATNVEPTWGASLNGYMSTFFADSAGTTTDPKLIVTYAPAPSSKLLLMGVG